MSAPIFEAVAPPHKDEKASPRSHFDVLGVKVSAIAIDEAVGIIEGWIERRQQNYVCVTGVHGIMECRNNDELRAIHNSAGLVTPDGMPLVWTARLRKRKNVRRVYGPDLMRIMSARSVERGYRHFYYGGGNGVCEALRARLTASHPALQVVGIATPPFRVMTKDEDEEIIERINASRPDIIWVGLSTPKQEIWMSQHLGRVDVPVMIGVGAAFDFLSGRIRQAPLWMQRAGLEWLFRLVSEPRRLWRRYFRIVPAFIALSAFEFARSACVRVYTGKSAPDVSQPMDPT